MRWRGKDESMGDVDDLGGRTRGEKAPLLIFHFLKFAQGGGRNFPSGENFMK
jgi:hypothetical protein